MAGVALVTPGWCSRYERTDGVYRPIRYYLLKDSLGSTDVITDAAWVHLHEHLDSVDLVHMNGRLY
jgi:hypothetical protein